MMIKTARDQEIYNSYYQAGIKLAMQQFGLLKLAEEGDEEDDQLLEIEPDDPSQLENIRAYTGVDGDGVEELLGGIANLDKANLESVSRMYDNVDPELRNPLVDAALEDRRQHFFDQERLQRQYPMRYNLGLEPGASTSDIVSRIRGLDSQGLESFDRMYDDIDPGLRNPLVDAELADRRQEFLNQERVMASQYPIRYNLGLDPEASTADIYKEIQSLGPRRLESFARMYDGLAPGLRNPIVDGGLTDRRQYFYDNPPAPQAPSPEPAPAPAPAPRPAAQSAAPAPEPAPAPAPAPRPAAQSAAPAPRPAPAPASAPAPAAPQQVRFGQGGVRNLTQAFKQFGIEGADRSRAMQRLRAQGFDPNRVRAGQTLTREQLMGTGNIGGRVFGRLRGQAPIGSAASTGIARNNIRGMISQAQRPPMPQLTSPSMRQGQTRLNYPQPGVMQSSRPNVAPTSRQSAFKPIMPDFNAAAPQGAQGRPNRS